MNIEKLDKSKHDRASFNCGEAALDNYLKTISGQHDKKDLSRTFVLNSDSNPSQIKGYYSLAACTVELDELPQNISKKYPSAIHCALVGRLAVHNTHQNQGLGGILLIDAIKKAVESSTSVPTPMIIVDAKSDAVKGWYEKMGFISFPTDKRRLYLTMQSAEKLLAAVDTA